MNLLTVRDLCVQHRERLLLSGVSFQLQPRQIVGLVGESGAGKSLTALAVLRLLPPAFRSRGQVRFCGQDLLCASEIQLCRLRGRRLAMVFQEPSSALNPLLSIGAQVAETIRIHSPALSKRQAWAAAEEVLARVELPACAVSPSLFPHQLSGGQCQRVVIAIAIAAQPSLLIADEPTAALDPHTQAEIVQLLVRLVREQGMAMLLISHDLALVQRHSQRTIIMYKGKIVESLATKTLARDSRHRYTKALFSSSQLDQLPSVVAKPPPLLQLDQVDYCYHIARVSPWARSRSCKAVTAVNVQLNRGEIVALVGKSGCGKSTLARLILGLLTPQQGQVLLEGQPTHHGFTREQRRKVQVVFQDPYASFNPRHRVCRLISEPLHLLPSPPRGRERSDLVAQVLVSVGLPPNAAARYIHQFSGGQRQRIALARALVVGPSLLVLDEPTSALDAVVRRRILALLRNLASTQSLSYLFITHDLAAASSFAHRVLVMDAGRIVEEGRADHVFTHPQHPATKALLTASRSLPANFD